MANIQPLKTLPPEAILALNAAHERETAPLSPGDYASMLAGAFYARGAAPDKAFLIAFDEGAPYGSPNFTWFKQRYDAFAYIDRIIVAEKARGRGLARALYEDLFRIAKLAGKPIVCCEVNKNPPNPGSDAFHAAMGFDVVGEATLGNGKTVRYMTKAL